ncbi:MAG: aldo/keto reductase, partial [Deltaproteobacteria bacterium]
LGVALKGRRDRALISTKATFAMGDNPNHVGSSRHWLIRAVEDSLRRLQTDYIDLFQLHGYDAMTSQDEVMSTLDTLVRAGKIRYTGVSNFSGWHLMKSLAVSDQRGWNRHVAHQAYYSLVGRDYEHELMGLGLEQGVGCVVWSPLGWGRLGGKYRRSNPIPADARAVRTADFGPPVPDDLFYDVMDALDAVAAEVNKSVAQVALNWVLGRPTVATAIFGATSEKQLLDNIGAVGWSLSAEHVAKLDKASERPLPYPYWHQASFPRNPRPV